MEGYMVNCYVFLNGKVAKIDELNGNDIIINKVKYSMSDIQPLPVECEEGSNMKILDYITPADLVGKDGEKKILPSNVNFLIESGLLSAVSQNVKNCCAKYWLIKDINGSVI